jgi:hypothetical protein
MFNIGDATTLSDARPPPAPTPSAQTSTRPEPTSRPVMHEPRITFVDQPTPLERDTILWAIDRFEDAGLQLPDLKISFPALCAGKGALYHVGQKSIEFCRVNRRRALHELAHAWDDASGAVDRQAFLELRGLSVWWGGTEMRSSEQGAEHLAEIIAWGLMGADPRDVPQLPANSVYELTRAFATLTGMVPFRQTTLASTRPS